MEEHEINKEENLENNSKPLEVISQEEFNNIKLEQQEEATELATQKKQSALMRFTNFLVDKRKWVFIVMMALTVAATVAMFFVTENDDMSRFLPNNSNMRRGLETMEQQGWSSDVEASPETFMIMFSSLQGDDITYVTNFFASITDETSINYNPLIASVEFYNGTNRRENFVSQNGNYRLFIVNTTLDYHSEAAIVMDEITARFRERFTLYTYHRGPHNDMLGFMIPIAIILMIGVLLLMCQSLFDPIIIFGGLGVAVMLNMGTNIFFAAIASMTAPVAGVMQFILSIVCTLIVLYRYKTEKKKLGSCSKTNNELAMKKALKNSTRTILSACGATFLGMLALMFMSFGIGLEMGIVFAKGVLFTVVSIYTVLPSLTLWWDKALTFCDKSVISEKRREKRERKLALENGAAIPLKIEIPADEINNSIENSSKVDIDLSVLANEIETDTADAAPTASVGAGIDRPQITQTPNTDEQAKTTPYPKSITRTKTRDKKPPPPCPICEQPLKSPFDRVKVGFAKFCFKFRFAIAIFFVLLFVGVGVGQSFLVYEFAIPNYNPVFNQFPQDTVVMVFHNDDNEHMAEVAGFLQGESVRDFMAFYLPGFGAPVHAPMLAAINDIALEDVQQVFDMANRDAMSLYDFLGFQYSYVVSDENHPFYGERWLDVVYLGAGQTAVDEIVNGYHQLIGARAMLTGPTHSRMIITLAHFAEGDDVYNFYNDFIEFLEYRFTHDFYFVGESAMAYELGGTFALEYLLISLLLAAALYIILALSFKKFLLPALLIAIVQCAVFVMMAVMAATGNGIFFLALIIVQSVVKGSSLEWGVLLANSYEEARRKKGRRDALKAAILNSGRVILTSALCMIAVTSVLGVIMSGQVAGIMLGMAIANLAAAILTMAILPALLVIFDRFVITKKKRKKGDTVEVATQT